MDPTSLKNIFLKFLKKIQKRPTNGRFSILHFLHIPLNVLQEEEDICKKSMS